MPQQEYPPDFRCMEPAPMPRPAAPAEPDDEEFDDGFDILLMPEDDFDDEL